MRIVLVLALAMMLAGSAMAANIAKDGYVEGIPQTYTDQLRSGPFLVVNILEAIFTDLCPVYSAALGGASCIYDPMGNWGNPGDYEAIVYNTSDNWWTSYNYGPDLATAGSYLDAGGCLWVVGQDFLYGGGAGAMNFVMARMGVISVNQDINFGDEGLLQWEGLGSLEYLFGSMYPCFSANPWFTDDVNTASPVAYWATPMGSGQAGSEGDMAFFSTVEFACDSAMIGDVVGALLENVCEGEPSPVDETTWGAIKNTWR